jgi:hypothetical protein
MTSYRVLGQPGGGGSLTPRFTLPIAYNIEQIIMCDKFAKTSILPHWLLPFPMLIIIYLSIREVFKGFVTQGPNLVEHTSITPNITGC